MIKRCLIVAIHPQPHPFDWNLRVDEIHGYKIMVGNHYEFGQLGILIPDGAIVPDKLAEEMWVKGKLAGKQKNRVKARDIRGVRSEALFYGSQGASWNPEWKEGDDVTDEIGVTFAQ